MAFGDLWTNKRFPDGCRSCGQTSSKHVGLGLCQSCYRNTTTKELARDLEADLSHLSIIDFDTTDEVVLEDDFADTFVSEERRPGSGTSPVESSGDVPPSVDKPGLFGLGKKSKPSFGPAPKTKEKAPKATTRRVSTSETIEDVWNALGGVAQRTGRHAPLGRYLQWQAPAAGELLDGAVAGTIIDRALLQPAVKTRGRLDMVVAVFGPPGIIYAIEQNPSRAQQLIPILKSAIRSSLPTLLPAMKKAQAKEEKVNKAVAEMFGDDFPPGVDPVDMVIEQMFAGWYAPSQDYDENEQPTDATTYP